MAMVRIQSATIGEARVGHDAPGATRHLDEKAQAWLGLFLGRQMSSWSIDNALAVAEEPTRW
jgi:hypothetical protein